MKNRIHLYLIILSIFLGFSACSEDYLTEVNPNNLTSQSFWRNLDDAQAGLNATYNAVLNHYIYAFPKDAMRTDQGWPGYGRPGGSSEFTPWYYLTYSSTDNSIFERWNGCYKAIFRANQVIEGLEKIKEEMTTEADIQKWNEIMGQARFFRGTLHFYLYSTYNQGSIIIRDFVPETTNEYNKGLSTAEEVFAFYMSDLQYAYNTLPYEYLEENQNKINDIDVGRITKGGPAMILANSYIQDGNIDSALYYYEDLINNPQYNYKLETKVHEMFSLEGEFNSESIFELNYNLTHNSEIGSWDENGLSNRWAFHTRQQAQVPVWAVYAFKTEAMDSLDLNNYYTDPDSPSGISMRNVPLRGSRMISIVEDEQSLYQGTKSIFEGATFQPFGYGFGLCKKYADDNDTKLASNWYSGKNVIVNRLSEAYIKAAECFLEKGDVQMALNRINAVRDRWGLVLLGQSNGDPSNTYDGYDYISNPDSLMDRIMFIESPLELWMEGVSTRWWNLRRWGVSAERYNSLANQTYYAIDYVGQKQDGGELTRSNLSIVKEVPADYEGSEPLVIDYEYKNKAISYNPSLHDWFEIPQGEAANNTEIN